VAGGAIGTSGMPFTASGRDRPPDSDATLSFGSLCAHRSVNPRGNASAYTPAKPVTVATPQPRVMGARAWQTCPLSLNILSWTWTITNGVSTYTVSSTEPGASATTSGITATGAGLLVPFPSGIIVLSI